MVDKYPHLERNVEDGIAKTLYELLRTVQVLSFSVLLYHSLRALALHQAHMCIPPEFFQAASVHMCSLVEDAQAWVFMTGTFLTLSTAVRIWLSQRTSQLEEYPDIIPGNRTNR